MPAIPVVCAVIERDGLVLIAQRPPGKHLPLAWEFPGGKVEPGETPEDAITRELREELGCETAIVRALAPFAYDYRTVVIEMIPYVVRLVDGSLEPTATEHVALQWLPPDALAAVDLAPADVPVLAQYRGLLP